MKETKLQRSLFVLEEFHRRPEGILDAYDPVLMRELGISSKQIGRFLEAIAAELNTIESVKIGRKKAYRLHQGHGSFYRNL